MQHGCDVNTPDTQGRTSLHKAIMKGDEYAASFLIDNGANLRAVTQDTQETPLHLTATYKPDNKVSAQRPKEASWRGISRPKEASLHLLFFPCLINLPVVLTLSPMGSNPTVTDLLWGGGSWKLVMKVGMVHYTETKKSPPRVMVMTPGHLGNTSP